MEVEPASSRTLTLHNKKQEFAGKHDRKEKRRQKEGKDECIQRWNVHRVGTVCSIAA